MKNKLNKIIKSFPFSVLLLIGLIVFIVSKAQDFEGSLRAEQTELIRLSVARAAFTCYATEGFYPESIDYLKSNYSLSVNEEHFICHYRYLGENLAPEIYIFSTEER